jgi:hypothetical protein
MGLPAMMQNLPFVKHAKALQIQQSGPASSLGRKTPIAKMSTEDLSVDRLASLTPLYLRIRLNGHPRQGPN